MQLVVKNTDEQLEHYRMGQEMVRFTCDICNNRKLIRLCDILPDQAICVPCQRSNGIIED